jgi:hypothetical protein
MEKDRAIDPMSGKNSPAKSPIRLEPLASGRAPALHACECLTMPIFEPIPFGLPPEADAAAFRRAR